MEEDAVIFVDGFWYVRYRNQVIKARWFEKAPAQIQLSLFKSGASIVTKSGHIKHVLMNTTTLPDSSLLTPYVISAINDYLRGVASRGLEPLS